MHPVRPRVAFELVSKDGRSARFDFPGGSDWIEAVTEACRNHFGAAPTATTFVALVDEGNHGTDPWIGARFEVQLPSDTTR